MLTGSAVLGMLSRGQARNASTGRMADAFSTCSRGSSALTVLPEEATVTSPYVNGHYPWGHSKGRVVRR